MNDRHITSTALIEGLTHEHLLKLSEDVLKKKTAASVVMDRDAEARIPKFKDTELQLGRVLGRGGFCVVSEVTKITLGESESHSANGEGVEKIRDEHQIHNFVQDRGFMETHCVRQGKDCRYAIKRLQEASAKDTQTFINGVVDLALEARFLSVIRHPNIIKMRGMGMDSPFDFKFFVVLDRLYDIMSTRLTKWKKQLPKGMSKLMDRGGKKELAFWVERCTVCYDLACALKHLHYLNIIYRDIKPDNIGFDVRGDVKIFDFGLAKEFDPNSVDADGTYKLTADTGSPRYMATEVSLGQPYNESCDVYSFCILLWQILKLETPFDGYTMNMFNKKVVQKGSRPMCDPKWPDEITEMLRLGWGSIIKSRPSMEDICSTLRDEIQSKTDEEVDEIMDASRKSELSLHRGF